MRRSFYQLLLFLFCAGTLFAQQFTVFGRQVQVHGFISQGFGYSNNNNFLTMKTSDGSAAFTDGGLNVSMALTDKLRIGAQAYSRNIGDIGDGKIQFDWGYADYRFASWFGVRGGKIKTTLGLYNDIQDTDTLFTWALLPQSVYPLDLRSNFISHTGGDVYGKISLKKAGSLDYVGYYGQRSFEKTSGTKLYAVDRNIPIDDQTGKAMGGDLRWNTPAEGLMVGGSFIRLTEHRIGRFANQNRRFDSYAHPNELWAAYADYVRGKWHFNGEWRQEQFKLRTYMNNSTTTFSKINKGNEGWFISGAYRVSKLAEVGSYYSRFKLYYPYGASATDPNADHINDKVVTLRLDPNRWWTVKVEGHFMDGYADPYTPRGFYSRVNSSLDPKTNMVVLRTGFSF